MSTRFRGILAATLAVILAGVLAWPAIMAAQIRQGAGYYYFFQVQNEYGEPFTADGFVSCSVYSPLANGGGPSTVVHSAATLAQGTGLAGPLYSNTNGIIHWYSAYTDPVDVVCYTKAGDSGRKKGMTTTVHSLKIDTASLSKVIRFPFSGGATAKYMTDSGLVIPEGSVVTGVGVQLATSPAQWAHLDVGFNGNHTVSTNAALARQLALERAPGFQLAHNASCFPPAANCVAGNHLGAALTHVTALSGNGTLRGYVPYMVHVTGGLGVNYSTPAGSQGGHVYIFFQNLHVGGVAGY